MKIVNYYCDRWGEEIESSFKEFLYLVFDKPLFIGLNFQRNEVIEKRLCIACKLSFNAWLNGEK